MLKIIIAFAAAVIPAYAGMRAARHVQRREYQLSLILQDIILITNCVKYTKEPPVDIFKKCASDIIKKVIAGIDVTLPHKNFHPVWERAVHDDKTLSEKDKQILHSLGASLGASVSDGQAAVLESTKVSLSAQLEEARTASAEKSKLYRKLGILCGIAAAAVIM